MALGTIATVATIVTAAASLANMGYQASQGTPQGPNMASASREIAEATARALPEQRALAAAAQQGGTTDISTAQHKEKVQRPYVAVPGRKGGGQRWIPYVESEWKPGGVYYNENEGPPRIHMRTERTTIPAGTKAVDFSGYGTADIEGELAKQFADIQTDLGAKYGTQFAEQARKEQEMADPEGTAARKKEYELIQRELENPMPISPLSSALDQQILGQLSAKGGIDDMERELLDSAVARANADRAGGASIGDVEQSMTTGYEGEHRRGAAQGKAGSWLASGSTPEDIEYRREQQALGNLGAFVHGQTPESQFSNLSGAQQGAAPFNPGHQLPNLPANAGAAGGPAAVAGYQAQLGQQGSQANNWMAGMSALLSGISAAASVRK